jgi:beta-lactamase class A
MGSSKATGSDLSGQIDDIARRAEAARVAVAVYDYETGLDFQYHGDAWFHAASTIKIPVLVGVFGAIRGHDLTLGSRVHVRNRFLSVVDGAPFRVEAGRDANSVVHQNIGKTMRVSELAHHMIVTSSNLATNLLIDVVGLERMQRTLASLGVEGVELRRGVEDERAFEEGINNQVTASGLVQVLRLIEEGKVLSEEASRQMLDILHEQEFRGGIPAGLPEDARVANKTGEISTAAHDAGLIYLPEREPYALAILTEWEPAVSSGRRETLARISRAIYEQLCGGGAG